MKKITSLTLLFLLGLLPLNLHAGITESKSFKISVTIPEHAMTPQQEPNASLMQIKTQKNNADFQLVEVRRDNQDVLLKTFVTK